MANLYSRFLDFIGIEEAEDEEEERDDYYRDERNGNYRSSRNASSRRRPEREEAEDDGEEGFFSEERPQPAANFRRQTTGARQNAAQRVPSQAPVQRERRDSVRQSNGGDLPISGGMKMIVYRPVSYEDTQIIIDNMKNRKPVIVNMEDIDLETAQRILDFLSGAVYATDGIMQKISRGIFVVAPNNYDVVANDEFGESM